MKFLVLNLYTSVISLQKIPRIRDTRAERMDVF